MTLFGLGMTNRPLMRCQTKYNTNGFSEARVFDNLGVSDKYAHMLSDAVNLALANNTKSQ